MTSLNSHEGIQITNATFDSTLKNDDLNIKPQICTLNPKRNYPFNVYISPLRRFWGVKATPRWGLWARIPADRNLLTTVDWLTTRPSAVDADSAIIRNLFLRWKVLRYLSSWRDVTRGRPALGLSTVVPVCWNRWNRFWMVFQWHLNVLAICTFIAPMSLIMNALSRCSGFNLGILKVVFSDLLY